MLRQITSIIEITNLNVEVCKSYLPVFFIICHYFPVNATGMANMLICRHFANLANNRLVCSPLTEIQYPILKPGLFQSMTLWYSWKNFSKTLKKKQTINKHEKSPSMQRVKEAMFLN